MRHRPGASSVVLVAVLAVVVPVCAVAQDGDSPEVQAPAEAGRPSGATVLVASAVYPGLGQLLNGAEPKAAVVSVAEAFLVAGLVLEDRRTRNAFRLYEQTGEARYFDDYSEHYDKRQALVWWVVVAALYGLTDAYVDAHLADFDEPESPRIEGTFESSDEGEAGVRLGLAVRF